MLGLNVDPTHQPFDPNLSAVSQWPDLNQSGPGFLAMLQDGPMGDSIPGAAPQCAPTMANTLVRADGRPMVPLPRTPPTASPAQMSPHVATLHGLPVSRTSTPHLTQSLFRQQRQYSPCNNTPLPSSPSLGIGPSSSRLFSRSVSAPLATPRRSSVQISSHLSTATRPGTPVGPTAGSVSATFTPPRSPAILGTPVSAHAPSITSPSGEVGMPDPFGPNEPLLPFTDNDPEFDRDIQSSLQPGSPVYVSSEAIANDRDGFLVAESELPPMKRTRLMNPASFAPTVKEIGENKRKEFRAIQKRRKYSMPQGKNTNKAGPKVGVNIGSFDHQKQGYLALMRASMTLDLIGYSPWSESEVDLRVRAIALADKGTGMKGENFVEGDFEVTVSIYY